MPRTAGDLSASGFSRCPCSFSRETPTRFKKELVKSVVKPSQTGVPPDALNQLLINIGRSDDILSEKELFILTDGQPTISAQEMMELI